MAKRRRKTTTTRRRRKSMSEFPLSRRGRKTTRRRKKARGLSEIFSPASFKDGGRASLSGALGGGIGFLADMLVPEGKPGLRAIVHIGASILLAGGFGMPNAGAGLAGAYVNNVAKDMYNKTLSEMDREEYADPDALDQYPDALDENGEAMYLAEDGNFYYLEEFDLAEDGNYYLSETMQANLYPGYINPQLSQG